MSSDPSDASTRLTDPAADVRAAEQALAAEARRLLREADPDGTPRLVRVAVSLPPEAADLMAWLRARAGGFRWYWSGRGEAHAVAAAGVAAEYASAGAALDALRGAASNDLRAYGGFRFDAEEGARSGSESWSAFGAGRLVVPRLELRRGPDAAALACILALPGDAHAPEEALRNLQPVNGQAAASGGALPAVVARADTPARGMWTASVEWALEAFAQSALEKVVLARETTLRFEDALDPLALFGRVREAAPRGFHFLMQPGGGAPVFLGASPERLFRQDGRRVASEAVAGTRPRGTSAGTDDALRDELLGSEKDRREHGYVRRYVRQALETLCTAVEADEEPSDLALAQGRHLYARLRGTLRPGVTATDVLAALHPTPAVGGVPTAEALRAIREQEPFDRGWYAGPVGWLGADAAEFAVAIRSGLAQGRRLALYSGAGLVAGSDPAREWAEVEQKIGDFAAVLGL